MKTVFVLAMMAASTAWAGDAVRGQQKAQACVACHGAQGAKPIDAAYPIIAGQPRDYLERVLLDYKAGTRKNAIMAGQVAALSKQDIADLATYFAVQPSPLKVK